MPASRPWFASLLLISALTGANVQANSSFSASVEVPIQESSEVKEWAIVNDTVMGGRSLANLIHTNKGIVFSGMLSLENNGGFASVRRVGDPIRWQSGKPFTITVQGDGRDYQFRLRMGRRFDGVAYSAVFSTEAGQESSYTFTEEDFTPVWRGRRVPGAPDLAFSDVTQLGFMLADKNPGSFSLMVKSIVQTGDELAKADAN